MHFEYIFTRLFEGVLIAIVTYVFYAVAKFAAAGNDSGHRRWDEPASVWRKVKVYGGGFMFAAGVGCLFLEHYGPHGLDLAAITFVTLGVSSAFGAASGFTRSLPPPRSIAEALTRLDSTSSLAHHVPSAEKHLAEARAFQAKVDASMAELGKKVGRAGDI